MSYSSDDTAKNVALIHPPPRLSRWGKSFILVLLTLFYLMVVLRTAWLSDDAYITLRTVDNFTHGLGLTWNAGERVQAYTHPLWMFLLSAISYFTDEVYYSTLFLSIVTCYLAVLLFAFLLADNWLVGAAGILALTLSVAFIDYSTSGLENPLSYLLLVLFAWLFLQRTFTLKSLFWLSITAALLSFNRLDLFLLVSPALLYATLKLCSKGAIAALMGGMSPLLLWELFALFYYGALLPNTAYAKLFTGLQPEDLIPQGITYLGNSLAYDPLTLITIIIAIVIAWKRQRLNLISLCLGILCYLGYIVRSGGDFMTGRMLTLPFLMAVIILSQGLIAMPDGPKKQAPVSSLRRVLTSPTAKSGYVILILLVLGMGADFPTPLSGEDYRLDNHPYTMIGEDGIADERGFYFQNTGLLRHHRVAPDLDHEWAETGKWLKIAHKKVHIVASTGFLGYYAGPAVYIIDPIGLTDPLLARLPAVQNQTWRIGHIRRYLPCGYQQTVLTGENHIKDPNLASYYDQLKLITRGQLFDMQRFLAIMKLNTGQFDYLLEAYLKNPACPPIRWEED